MFITEDVIAFKYCDQDSEYDDVIALEDIVSCQDMSALANSENSLLWSQEGTSFSRHLLFTRALCYGPSADTRLILCERTGGRVYRLSQGLV